MDYKLIIGEGSNDLPKTIGLDTVHVIVSEEQLKVIELFAHTTKDKNFETVYRLNDKNFKIVPII